MKKSMFALLLLTGAVLTFAQNPVAVGQTQINAGVGLGSWGIPVYVGFDYGFHKDITLGAEVSYQTWEESWHSNNYDRSVIGISGNGNYHFNHVLNIPTNWDFYAGLNLGFYIWNKPDEYEGDNTSGLGLGAQVGGRYYFSDKTAVNLEFGGGNAFAGGKLGLSFKL